MEKKLKLECRQLKSGLLIAWLASQAFGADVTMTVNPPVVVLGESAQIRVEVRGAKRPQAPDFPTVDGLQFSGTGQSSQTSIANGKIDKSVAYTINVYPQRTGEFTIGPIQYTVDKETRQLLGKLKVVTTSGSSEAQSWNDVTFAKITSNRHKTYVQEPFELTLSIYSRSDIQLAGNISLQGLPETGISEPAWEEISERKREQINGVLYDVRHFRTILRTMGSGIFEFAPQVTVQVVAPQQRRRNDPFGGFGLFNSVQTIPVELQTDPVSINVLPLPTQGKPAGFSGAVGQFHFQVTASPTDVHPGDPITLQMTIIGEGNYDRVMPPALPDDAPFRMFGDAMREQRSNGVRFEQVISPTDASITEIPAITFSYFDSEGERYRTLKSPAIPITVTASSNDTAQVFASQETLIAAPSDQPFASESDVQRFLGWLQRIWKKIHPWLWTLPAILGIGIVLFFARKLYHHRRKDTVWLRRQQAPKAARRAIKAADNALRENNPSAFYEKLGDALSSYFGNRLNLAPGDVTPTIVLNALKSSKIDLYNIDDLQNIFEQLESIRYGVSSVTQSAEEMKKLKTRIENNLRTLEKLRF